MSTQEAYAARLEAQMRTADARLDEMEAQARARNARAEMDEISGLRARRDKIRQQVAEAKQKAGDDWEGLRSRVEANWSELRRDVIQRHTKFTVWDEARERRFVAHLDEAEAALRESAAKDAAVAAEGRIGLAEAGDELRDKAARARTRFAAWRQRQQDARLQGELAEAEAELEDASEQYAMALKEAVRGGLAR
jgi:hypothetical protein